jgi:hypothetical protein
MSRSATAFGVRPLALYEDGDAATLVFAVAVEAGRAPEDTAAFAGAAWALIDDDDARQPGFTEIRNPESLGVGAVRFSTGSLGGPAAVDVRRNAAAVVVEHTLDVDIAGLPIASSRSFEVPLADGVTLLVTVDVLGADAAEAAWELKGDDVLAEVDLIATFPETASGDADPTQLVSKHIAPPYPFQRPRLPRPTPSSSGSDVLSRIGPEIAQPDATSRAVIDVVVRVYRPAEDAAITIRLDGLGIGED